MKNEALYHKTVDILVAAYFADTLMHGTCYACAVGNIIAANIGAKVIIDDDKDCRGNWSKGKVLWDEAIQFGKPLSPNRISIEALKQIECTGYSIEQMAAIEKAFENAPCSEKYPDDRNDEWMFSGLMAVIEVLDQIHENTDTEVTKVSKQKFVKA